MGFQQGLSGLNAASRNLDVIGHNIANANTTGFKSSRAEFADMVASSMGVAKGGNNGMGVEVAAVAQQFTQGNITSTGNGMDLAINGNGFFKVRLPSGQDAYTRAGNFQLDKNGDVRTNGGAQVMGFNVDPTTGIAAATATPLSFPLGAPIAAKQTTSISVALNLDARAKGSPEILDAGGAVVTAAVDPDPRTTYGTSVNVFDSQGVALPVSLYFQKNGSNTWNIYDKDKINLGNPAGTPAILPTGFPVGSVTMDGNGQIQSLTTLSVSPVNADGTLPADVDPTSGLPTSATKITKNADGTFSTTTLALTWTPFPDPADPTTATDYVLTTDEATAVPVDGTPSTFDFNLALSVNPSTTNPNSPPTPFSVNLDLSKITQFGNKFAVSDLRQDGYTAGELTSINTSDDGSVMASYSNGVTRKEAQVALASFRNPQGLTPIGGNNWVETADSGNPLLGTPGSGNFGTLRSGALEDSNVDLTAELVGMMTAQRSYQANAQTIKTQDQVLSTIVNLR